MPPIRRAFHSVRAATALDAARPAYAAGFRASIATVLPLVIASRLGPEAATWASLGGFNVALSDRGGPYRTRAATMTAVMLCSALTALLGALAGGRIIIAIPLTFAVAVAAGLARVWQTAGISVGGAMLSTYVISLAYPTSTAVQAFERAGFVIAGGVLAMMIALVIWPLQPYRPARVAVAESYRALSGYVDQMVHHLEALDDGAAPSDLPAGSATVRGTLETARRVLAQTRRGRPGTAGREQRLIVLGEVVDQLFGHVVAIGETLDSIAPGERIAAADRAAQTALAQLSAITGAIAAATEAEGVPAPIPAVPNGDAIRAALDRGDAHPAGHTMVDYRHSAAILDRAADFASSAVSTVEALNSGRRAGTAPPAPLIEDVDESESPLATLRTVLSRDSLLLRHALRVAVTVTVAVALTELFHLKRGYWMTITVIVIMQPYASLTSQRALQRVIGTVVGALITAALGALFHDPRAILLLSFVFAALCVATLPVNYAAYSVFLTPTFVLLAEASAGDWHLAGTRVLNTLLGGALALIGSRFLWPSPERSRLPGYLAQAARANRDYLRVVSDKFADRSEQAGEAMRSARRNIGLATVNAEESFQRLVGESSGDASELSPVMTFLTYTRRLTASVAALAIARYSAPPESQGVLAAFMRLALPVLDDLGDAVEVGRRPAPLPILLGEEDAGPARDATLVRARVDRLARQIRMLHDALDRWEARRDGEPDRTTS
ncbi:MAG TPA: FUSC family protein [Gemmatimonadaceae bacterium]